MTSEQLEAARAERMRQNGRGTLTFEEARTWMEETGFCLFLPKRQFAQSVAPSFVEALGGRKDATPEPRQIAAAEEMLVRLENEGVVVRLNLQGQPTEQPDFIVASWVLPYVYALRGDRDWRRSPQLTGSRQVSPLAIQAYKLLEAGATNVASLKHALGREVTEAAVMRAITELWQQLRIIPMIEAPGKPADWQLLRVRFQKAIAEGASTSQVTAISVLASIYLQAVIAATMEDVEVFLSPLTARSKVREVIRGLVATRQVHTLSLGHAPHFYVAGTLPEFSTAPSIYASSIMPATNPFLPEEEKPAPVVSLPVARGTEPVPAAPVAPVQAPVMERPAAAAPRYTPVRKPAAAAAASEGGQGQRPRFSRPASHLRDRKPTGASAAPARSSFRSAQGEDRPKGARPSSAPSNSPMRSKSSASSAHGSKSAAPSWGARKNHTSSSKPGGKPVGKSGKPLSARADARPVRAAGKPAGKPAGKNFRFAAANKQGAKKRG